MTLAVSSELLALRAKLFRGLADPSRLAILEALRDGPRTVGDLAAHVGLQQPNVSNHLSCLRECGLVSSAQQGRYVHYRLSDGRITTLLGLADTMVAEVARGVYACTRYAETDTPQVEGSLS
ncbi:metalloregulator ArsR/SmtB family transcription factor [Deinococcus sp. MIMF12]|uniref:Metalloregulator ArsR/SmtB family transcription factor n=1 Tax=Deinococcus rhizophilus TaxID=3049544 RepID=A0ABT7JLA0_9DEIO|nr:metalloregulator ArsR/SmtB family transcription factor [Deinococcus rhizophilus]MDL2345823.1 metalloregulator ArsR/SmtB family transcription factor [Deinococcus rhizophilus]